MPFGKLSKRLAHKLDSKIEQLSGQFQSFGTGNQPSQPYPPPSHPNHLPPQPQAYSQPSYPPQAYSQQIYLPHSSLPQAYPSPQSHSPQPHAHQSHPSQTTPQSYLPQPYPSQSYQLPPHIPQPYPSQSDLPPQPHPLQPDPHRPPQAHPSRSYPPHSDTPPPRPPPPQDQPKYTVEQETVSQSAPTIRANPVPPPPVEPTETPTEPTETLAEPTKTPAERGLCEVCAQYDWEYHINRYYDDRVRSDRDLYIQLREESLSSPDPYAWGNTTTTRAPYRGKFVLTPDQTSFELQPYSAMVKNQESCSFCQLIVSAVESPQWLKDPHWTRRDTTSTKPVTCEIAEPQKEYPPWADRRGFFSTPSLTVSFHDRDPMPLKFQNFARTLDLTVARYPHPNNADLAAIQNSWSTCKWRHGVECDTSKESIGLSELGVIRLIDVQEECVITASAETPYVALSYKWGTTEVLTASKKEMIDGQLSLRDKAIPQTIRDAMNLVKQMDERYLWVDALCIIQDDPTDVDHYVRHMDQIYKAALFTIINASGADANAGLEGLEPGSRDFRLVQGTIEGVKLIEQPTKIMLSKSVWAQRAWTYQEYILSRRRVIFAGGCVFYHCTIGITSEFFPDHVSQHGTGPTKLGPHPHALDTEWLDPHIKDRRRPEMALAIKKPESPALKAYARNVEIYSGRRAGNQADSLNAFQGILADLALKHKLKFCWGLPTPFFCVALGWQVWASESQECGDDVDEATVARYREARYRWDRVPGREKATTWFPSWSWASCDYAWLFGVLDPSCWESGVRSWPWDPGYRLDRTIDPFVSGVLQIDVECAILHASMLTVQFNGALCDSPVVLDDMTLLSHDASMKFARIADIRGHSYHIRGEKARAVNSKDPSSVLVQVIGLEELAEGTGTYRRRCALVIPMAAWRSASISREVIQLM